ncbi:MAG: HTTM domain-containing protein [Myxococcales bacterium]|nr:HTTM domain-containing protein [Myxococcales bacterium]MCB9714975.1 HTTM domain-containing protein [Myxococcales bacterium]
MLALFDDKVPNEEALALGPLTGWLMLLAALAVVSLLVLTHERWRRWWLQLEDPRSIGLYRIVFGFFVICNMNDFYEYFTFLFTDEGIFTADVARHVHARGQFAGFGDGLTDDSPWGFFDTKAILTFLEGPKYSLLYFWDTPQFFWGHMIAFWACAVLFMVGFRTRLMGVLTFVLMNSIFFRNHLFWEGTELVYRVFLAYLICAKAGHAYSVDNWLRCRKLRRKGLLSTRDGPGGGAGLAPDDEHPKGLQAVYRLIPAWPRRLMMLQLATVYCYTGTVKNGSVWAKGDAIYYAWNMDHFYRFHPQQITAVLGTNVLRLATWVTHWGEALFPLCLCGVMYFWARREGFAPVTGIRRILVRLCWAALGFASVGLVWVTWDVHFGPVVDAPLVYLGLIDAPNTIAKELWCGGMVVVMLGGWWLWHRLDRKPFVVRTLLWLRPLRKPLTIDRDFFAAWTLGRRVWIPWHIGVMGGIFTLMNIGQFQTGMLSATIIFFTGEEIARFGRFVFGRLRWLPLVPRSVKDREPPLPAEDPSLPHLHHDTVRFPQWAMWVVVGGVLVGILVKVAWAPEWWARIWIGTAVFGAGVMFQTWRTHRGRSPVEGEPPWAYGALGRFLVSGLLAWHIAAVATWLTPDKDSLESWRNPARQVFAKYLTITQTDQGWGMFAPNPPRSNVFLKVLVTDEDGEVWDMRTDVYAPERKPIPWIWNDRMRKMNRRIIGGESGNTQWYRKWYARWHCRQWQLEHEGQIPRKVELVKVWYQIPSPEETAVKGYYVPEDLLERTGHEKVEYTEHCRNAVMGQLPDWIRERHGLPPLPEGVEYRPWLKHKKKAWDRMRAKERGEEPPEDAATKDKDAELEERKAKARARAKARAEARERVEPE